MEDDDFYIESFFKKETIAKPVKEKKPIVHVEEHSVEIYEITHQMYYHLDQVEKAIANEFKNASDFQFGLNKIREKLKLKNIEGVLDLVNDLEELLDIQLKSELQN